MAAGVTEESVFCRNVFESYHPYSSGPTGIQSMRCVERKSAAELSILKGSQPKERVCRFRAPCRSVPGQKCVLASSVSCLKLLNCRLLQMWSPIRRRFGGTDLACTCSLASLAEIANGIEINMSMNPSKEGHHLLAWLPALDVAAFTSLLENLASGSEIISERF